MEKMKGLKTKYSCQKTKGIQLMRKRTVCGIRGQVS